MIFDLEAEGVRMIRWETASYSRASNAQYADVQHCEHSLRIVRLYVSRIGKGARQFSAHIDGGFVHGAWDSMDAAKVAVIKEARSRGLIT